MKLHLAHILVTNRYEAEDLLRKLNLGETFAGLAQRFSSCASASNGGNLGEIDLRRLDPDFAEAAQKLKIGEISPITRTRYGHHLIKRLEPVSK